MSISPLVTLNLNGTGGTTAPISLGSLVPEAASLISPAFDGVASRRSGFVLIVGTPRKPNGSALVGIEVPVSSSGLRITLMNLLLFAYLPVTTILLSSSFSTSKLKNAFLSPITFPMKLSEDGSRVRLLNC